MTTLLGEQPSAASNAQSPDAATADQVVLHVAALAPMIARLAPDIEQGRQLPAELVSDDRCAGQTRWVSGLECHGWQGPGPDTVPDEPDIV